jgi:hypothetical protein
VIAKHLAGGIVGRSRWKVASVSAARRPVISWIVTQRSSAPAREHATAIRNPRSITAMFGGLALRFGFPDKLRFHDLRASHETALLDPGRAGAHRRQTVRPQPSNAAAALRQKDEGIRRQRSERNSNAEEGQPLSLGRTAF